MRRAFSTGLEEMGTDLVIAKELSVRVWGGVITCPLVSLFFFREYATSTTLKDTEINKVRFFPLRN